MENPGRINFSHLFTIPPGSDWLNLLVLFGAITVFILISEWVRKSLHWSQEATRKIVHIAVGLLLLLTPLLLKNSLPLLAISAFFTVFNFIALRKDLLPGIHIDRNNFGTVYYAFSFFVLVLLFWYQFKVIIIAAMMVMAVGDAAAAIVGNNTSNPHRYFLIRDQKSVEGSVSMFIVSVLSIFCVLLLYPPNGVIAGHSIAGHLIISVFTAIIATAAEALGDKGNDNLSVPLLSAVVLYFLLNSGDQQLIRFGLGLLLGFLIAIMSFRAAFLSGSGAVSTFLLAAIVFGFGGWAWTIPILTFFILSSLLSKLGKAKKRRYDLIFEKGSRRDFGQVIANGGLAGLLMSAYILFPDPAIHICYLGALASAMADTWATEIGILAGQRPRLITNMKPVESGTSGGITVAGLAGAFAGAVILALSGSFFFPQKLAHNSLALVAIIAFGGLFGSLVDSLIGATAQVQYRCALCHKITEKRIHCENFPTQPVSGIGWINNDVVNFANTISGTIFILVTAYIFRMLN